MDQYPNYIESDDYIKYAEKFNTISMIFYILLGIAIWYFSHKKLKEFSDLLPNQNGIVSQATVHTTTEVKENISSISDKLIELKKLLDNGVITKEEFTKLKSEVISKYK